MPKSVTDKQKEDIRLLYNAGFTIRDIAKRTGLNPTTVHRHLQNPLEVKNQLITAIANHYFDEKQDIIEEMVHELKESIRNMPSGEAMERSIAVERLSNALYKASQTEINKFILDCVKEEKKLKQESLLLDCKVEEEKEENSD